MLQTDGRRKLASTQISAIKAGRSQSFLLQIGNQGVMHGSFPGFPKPGSIEAWLSQR